MCLGAQMNAWAIRGMRMATLALAKRSTPMVIVTGLFLFPVGLANRVYWNG